MRGPGGQRRFDLVDPVDLYDDAGNPGIDRTAHRFLDRSGDRDMIVLDHRRVPQSHAVIGRPAHPRRIFLKDTQPRDGLARIQQRRAGSIDRIDIGARHRRDAAQMLDRIERRSLRRQHRPRLPANPHDVGPPRDPVTILMQQFNHHIRIERPEESGCDRQSRQRHRVPRVHHPIEHRIGGNHSLAGDVPPLRAEIFGERGSDESVKVETGKGEGHGVLSSYVRSAHKPFSPCETRLQFCPP